MIATRRSLLATFLGLAVLASPCGARGQTHNQVAKGNASGFQQLQTEADRARNEGRDDDAIRLYGYALALRPGWQEGRWYRSTLLYEKERFSEARDDLRQFVAVEPQAGPGWAVLGLSEYQTRDYDRALDHLRKAISLGLGDRKDLSQSVFYFVAVLLTRDELYDNAMNVLIPMVKSSTQTDILVEPLGLAALRLPLLPKEIPADRRELVQMAGRATLAVEAQQLAEAEALFQRMIAEYPNEPGIHFLYGAFLTDLRPEEGIRELQREIAINPAGISARLRLAEELMKEGKLAEALALAEQAVKLEPDNSGTRLILGEVLVAKGDLAKGIQELEKARDQMPERVRTHWALLRAYTEAGRTEDAKREKETIESLISTAGRQ